MLGVIIVNIVWLDKEFCSSWSLLWNNFAFILHGRCIFSCREGRLIFSHLLTNTPVIIIICCRQHANISNKSIPTQYLYKTFIHQTLTSLDIKKVFIALQLFNHLSCFWFKNKYWNNSWSKMVFHFVTAIAQWYALPLRIDLVLWLCRYISK